MMVAQKPEPLEFQPGENWDAIGFPTFEYARAWAGETVRGFPAWRVVAAGLTPEDRGIGRWIVELIPGGPWAVPVDSEPPDVGAQKECPTCRGYGVRPSTRDTGCEVCHGTGTVDPDPPRPDYVTHEELPDGSVHPFPFPIRVF